MKAKLIKAMIFSNGAQTLPIGTELEVTYNKEASDRIIVQQPNGRFVTIRCVNAHKYFKQFKKAPSLQSIEKMDDNASATTITGKTRVECDGVGPDGFPAWPLALGLI